MVYATIEEISKYLNIGRIGKSKNLEIALKFLPDILDPGLLENEQEAINWKNERARSALIYGNFYEPDYLSKSNKPINLFSNKNNTMNLLEAIKRDDSFRYKDGLGTITCKQNMMNKLQYLVSQTSGQKIDMLFSNLELLPFFDTDLRNLIHCKIKELHKKGNHVYGLFLLVLTAVFRDEVRNLPHLYSDETIRENIVKCDMIVSLPNDCVYFSDPNYMNTYNVFLYRNIQGEDHLYDKGILKLSNDGIIPSAELILHDSFNDDGRDYHYLGVPMQTGNMIYLPMGDKMHDNALGILVMEYENFTNGMAMYFRLGLFLSCEFRYKKPQVQRIIIAPESRILTKADEGVIRGLLRTSGTKIVFTQEELEEFAQDESIQQENWIEGFRKWILPELKSKKYNNCCITEEAIMDFQKGKFSSPQLIRIAYALKNFTESQWRKKNTHILCDPPEDFHYIMRGE